MSTGKGILAIAVLAAMLAACAPAGPPTPDDAQPSTSPPIPDPETGWAIHDSWHLANGLDELVDGVSCESPYGPWHLVLSGDLAAFGLSSFDAYYDVTIDPASGSGTLTGSESQTTTSGDTYVGGSTGTATLDSDATLMSLVIDSVVTWSSPNIIILPGQETIHSHVEHELDVIAATAEECA